MHPGTRFTLLPLLWGVSIVLAQEASFPQVPACNRPNSSRLPSPECGYSTRSPLIIRHELESTTHIAVPEIGSLDCKADILVQYLQRNAIARVDGTIHNGSCAASRGSFVVSIRTLDESGELKTQDFSESWMRDDDQPVTFSDDYEIGEDVDLVSVRAVKIQCKCDSPQPTAHSPASTLSTEVRSNNKDLDDIPAQRDA